MIVLLMQVQCVSYVLNF